MACAFLGFHFVSRTIAYACFDGLRVTLFFKCNSLPHDFACSPFAPQQDELASELRALQEISQRERDITKESDRVGSTQHSHHGTVKLLVFEWLDDHVGYVLIHCL